MANPYTPTDGGPLSYWQQRVQDEAAQREAAAAAAWSYPYIYDKQITKQYDTWKTTGSTFSIDPELQFVGRPNKTYSMYTRLVFSGGYNSFQSGITVAISGTSTATGNTYETNYGSYYLASGSPVFFTGTSVSITGYNTNRITVQFYSEVTISSDVLAWNERNTPATIGPFWKINAGAPNGAYLMKGSTMYWHTTVYSGGTTGFTAQV